MDEHCYNHIHDLTDSGQNLSGKTLKVCQAFKESPQICEQIDLKQDIQFDTELPTLPSPSPLRIHAPSCSERPKEYEDHEANANIYASQLKRHWKCSSKFTDFCKSIVGNPSTFVGNEFTLHLLLAHHEWRPQHLVTERVCPCLHWKWHRPSLARILQGIRGKTRKTLAKLMSLTPNHLKSLMGSWSWSWRKFMEITHFACSWPTQCQQKVELSLRHSMSQRRKVRSAGRSVPAK